MGHHSSENVIVQPHPGMKNCIYKLKLQTFKKKHTEDPKDPTRNGNCYSNFQTTKPPLTETLPRTSLLKPRDSDTFQVRATSWENLHGVVDACYEFSIPTFQSRGKDVKYIKWNIHKSKPFMYKVPDGTCQGDDFELFVRCFSKTPSQKGLFYPNKVGLWTTGLHWVSRCTIACREFPFFVYQP